MAVQPQFLIYILEHLQGLGRLRSLRMFGGVGLYSGELFFGIIDDDTVFFKSDATNSADYTARNMPRFMPFPDRPDAVLAYYQVPADIIEDPEAFVAWARKAVVVALTSHVAKRARVSRVRPKAKRRKIPAKAGRVPKTAKAANAAKAVKRKRPASSTQARNRR